MYIKKTDLATATMSGCGPTALSTHTPMNTDMALFQFFASPSTLSAIPFFVSTALSWSQSFASALGTPTWDETVPAQPRAHVPSRRVHRINPASVRLSKITETLGLSKTQMAETIGVSRRGFYDWSDGKSEPVRKEYRAAISWLEDLSKALAADQIGTLGRRLDQRLGPDSLPLGRLLATRSVPTADIARWLADVDKSQASRPVIGGWLAHPKGPIPGISDVRID